MQRQNERGYNELSFQGEHLKFGQLQKRIQNKYLLSYQFVPKFPHPVEFYVSNLRHDTNFSSFQAILNDGGFKKPGNGIRSTQSLVWWSLAISEGDIADAERRFLGDDKDYNCKPFLHKFTSSPAFRKSSRLGNFRFTFTMKELLASYSTQFCMGQAPQMRIYETVIYKQEVMHAIVVHGPDAKGEFKRYPLLQDSANGVLAFRVPQGMIFKFDQETLVKHLSLCQGAGPKLSNEEFIKCEFEASPAK
ncbi:hypothetical protein MHYP_G00353960 [Metynnis hypsauchen]